MGLEPGRRQGPGAGHAAGRGAGRPWWRPAAPMASGVPDRRYPPRSVRYLSVAPGAGSRLAHIAMYP